MKPFLQLFCLALSLAVLGGCRGDVHEPDPHDTDDDDDAGTSSDRDGGATRRDAGGSDRDAGRGGGSTGDAAVSPGSDAGTTPPGQIWRPAPGISWQWQLSGTLDTSFDVSLYDIDLYDTAKEQIAALHAQGRKVVCYFDTAYEPGRPDEAQLRPYRGKTIDGWPDQNWVDIRKPAVMDVMKRRMDLAVEKKCDGVEADDVDVANNDTGFDISQEEQRTFIRTLAREAHARGLAYGLKNALEDVEALVGDVDFALNEQCYEFDECKLLKPFIDAGKAVFNVEYPTGRESLSERGKKVCASANALGMDSLVKNLDLGPPRYACK